MLPIHLDWMVPIDGAELSFDDTGATVRYLTERERSVAYRLSDLEDPVALRLINSRTDDELVRFVSRFGLPSRYAVSPFSISLAMLHALRENTEELLSMSKFEASRWLTHANDLLRTTALNPSFEFSEKEGRQQLVLRPSSLDDLINFECALALDAGAVMARCAHCDKAFLTGPLTGRRSHSIYCSDRCRVAAMRARKAAKMAWQEGF